MSRPIRVYPFTLTTTGASEHIYGKELTQALSELGIEFVSQHRKADVVHLFEVNLFTVAALKSMQIPELLRILYSDTPVVVSTDDLYFIGSPELTARPELYQLNGWTQQWLFNKCDAIIAISESVRNSLEPAIPNTEVHVVRHGVHSRYFTEPTDAKEPFVFHASFASKRKNPDAIVQMARALDSRFVIAGGGWEERIPPDCQGDGTEVLGYVSEDKLVELYHDASVFYFPTRHEGFGLPILEAMAAANAVVSTDVYSVPEVTNNAALLHKPGDVDNHIESVERLLDDPQSRQKLAKKAKTRAKQFTWKDAAAKTKSVYELVK